MLARQSRERQGVGCQGTSVRGGGAGPLCGQAANKHHDWLGPSRRAQRLAGRGELGHVAVSLGVDDAAAELLDDPGGVRLMELEGVTPRGIALLALGGIGGAGPFGLRLGVLLPIFAGMVLVLGAPTPRAAGGEGSSAS